jgi:hypothetical protein
MSSVEARVHLALEQHHIPFTWRYFDAKDLAPHIAQLMPDFAPEFTLREYKTVIMIQGGYFGSLPGVLDKVALAEVLLEADGWTVAILYEQDILNDIQGTLAKALPWFNNPPITGPPRKPPIGTPDFMSKRRQALSEWALHRGKYALTRQEEEARAHGDSATGRRRRRPRRTHQGRRRYREAS